jgi:hypothetical protein
MRMKRGLAVGLWCGFVLAGALLAARTWFGPLTVPIPMRSPINAEGWLAIALGLLVAMGARSSASAGAAGASFGGLDWWLLLSLAGLIGAVFAGSRNDLFLADDYRLTAYARDFTVDLHRMLVTPGGDGFFRPVTNAVFGMMYRWAGFDVAKWHLAGFALHWANCALVFLILRQMAQPRPAAWFAAALFAIHGTRPEAVVWIGGRFDVVATFFVLASAALFLQYLEREGALWLIAASIAMILGILSKESAYAGPPILVALAWARGRPWRSIAAATAPFFVAAAALLAYRWILFGNIGGYLDPSGRPQALLLSPVNVVKALAFRIWAVLLFPLNWSAAPGVLVGVAMVLYLAVLAWIAATRAPRRELIAPLAIVLVAALPPLQQLLIGADMEKARYLYLPAVGFCWLLAAMLGAMGPRAGGIAGAAVLLFNLAAIDHNLAAWHWASRQTHAACVAAASCARDADHRVLAAGLPRTARGAPLFAWGFEECTRREMAGTPVTVVERDTPPSAEESADYACVFEWDAAAGELRRVR